MGYESAERAPAMGSGAPIVTWTKRELEPLLAKLKDIEELLKSADLPGQVHRAGVLALSIAQTAPTSQIAELAQLTVDATRGATADAEIMLAVRRLRLAIQEAWIQARPGAVSGLA